MCRSQRAREEELERKRLQKRERRNKAYSKRLFTIGSKVLKMKTVRRVRNDRLRLAKKGMFEFVCVGILFYICFYLGIRLTEEEVLDKLKKKKQKRSEVEMDIDRSFVEPPAKKKRTR